MALPPSKEKTLGIDLGVKMLATLSDGRKFENQKFLEQAHREVARLQRKLARSQKAGKNYEKVVLKQQKAYEKVTLLRENYYHIIANVILDGKYKLVGLEDLNVKGMVKNHRVARVISDVAFSEFKRILTYKAPQHGIAIVEVGRIFPSSQICNDCNYQFKELTLTMLKWNCPKCGVHHDRDNNASLNIRDESIQLFLTKMLVAKVQSLQHPILPVKAVVSPEVKSLSIECKPKQRRAVTKPAGDWLS